MSSRFHPAAQGLYDPANEHDACGVGFVAHIKGKKIHAIVEQGLHDPEEPHPPRRGGLRTRKLGDGAGILIQIPDRFFREEMAKQGVKLPPLGQYGVGMVFLPQRAGLAPRLRVRDRARDQGRRPGAARLARRAGATTPTSAEPAKKLEPVIRQVFIGRGARRHRHRRAGAQALHHPQELRPRDPGAQARARQGVLRAVDVGAHHRLQGHAAGRPGRRVLPGPAGPARRVSALALVHQRFSTNTFPTWDLAHPFRMIAHNGEINTLRGNVNWIRARQGAISSPILGKDLDKIWPLIYDGQSDSASFDNALELLVMGGYSIAHAMMMMIPEAWENHTLMDPSRRAFYEYHAAMMEPWDGPAAIAFTDGRQIGATLDRNGLRPARYIVTDDDLVIMGSECGCLPIPEEQIVKKWRLQPGKMFLVDLEKGRIIDDKELKDALASAKPYAEWIERIRIKLDDVETEKTAPLQVRRCRCSTASRRSPTRRRTSSSC